MHRLVVTVALLVSTAPVRADGPNANAHLLAGVRAFRAQSYELALAEFHQVEQAGGTPDLALYLGPTLYKLGRFDDARLVLARAHRAGSIDSVAEYYLGLTYYRLGLWRLARVVFATLDRNQAGPKLAEGAARFVAEIDRRPSATADAAPPLTAAE